MATRDWLHVLAAAAIGPVLVLLAFLLLANRLHEYFEQLDTQLKIKHQLTGGTHHGAGRI